MATFKWNSKADEDENINRQLQEQIEKEELDELIKTAPARVAMLEEENMSLMLALAEMYETMMGGTL